MKYNNELNGKILFPINCWLALLQIAIIDLINVIKQQSAWLACSDTTTSMVTTHNYNYVY